MPDITGEAIDRLITIEAKNRGMPFNVLAPMYEAARKLGGGRPLAMLAAEKLKAALKPGSTVLILTGAGYAPTMPEGESDGPPGAASLARILYKGLGAVPVFCCEPCHTRPIVASSLAAGLMVKDRFADARDRHLGAGVGQDALRVGAKRQRLDGGVEAPGDQQGRVERGAVAGMAGQGNEQVLDGHAASGAFGS